MWTPASTSWGSEITPGPFATCGTVIFDVGNVLLSWDPERLVREQLPQEADPDRVLREVFAHKDWVELDRGSLEEEQANQRFADRLGMSLPAVRALILASKASLSLMTESAMLLEELHRAGRRLLCLTNMARGTFDFVHRRFEFFRRFEGILVSAQVGLIKPDRAIFERLIETYKVDPNDAAFVDDNEANVKSAAEIGLQAFLFTDAADAREKLTA